MIEEIPFLSAAQCDEIAATVMSMRPSWTPRMADRPFFTLGTASYIDAVDSPMAYLSAAARLNPVLEKAFAPVYVGLADVLDRRLGAPARSAFALPGFHIFLGDKAFEQPLASVHFDWQHNSLPWPKPFDFTRPISFTVAVALPRNGAGLNYWAPAGVGEPMAKHFHPYRLGVLNLHSGYVLHQIAPLVGSCPEDRRITLQGHAVFSDGAWWFYW